MARFEGPPTLIGRESKIVKGKNLVELDLHLTTAPNETFLDGFRGRRIPQDRRKSPLLMSESCIIKGICSKTIEIYEFFKIYDIS